MNAFFLDLWHDLKQKRLWPLAVVMLASIPAVPLVLSKPADDPGAPAPAPAVQARAGDQLPLVDLEAVPASSNLETFDVENPFSPSKDIAKPPAETGSGGGAATDGGKSGGSSSAGTAKSDSSGGGSGSTGGSTGSTGDSGGGTFWFTFEVDVKFGPVGDLKRYKGLQALDVLPDPQQPVVTFMGLKDDMKTALFMVLDPGVQASGEGKCSPSPERCTFIELRASDGRDEMLLDSSRGEDYSLQLLSTKRVKIDEPTEQTKTKDATASSRKEKSEHKSLPFFLPRLLERAAGE